MQRLHAEIEELVNMDFTGSVVSFPSSVTRKPIYIERCSFLIQGKNANHRSCGGDISLDRQTDRQQTDREATATEDS